MSRICFVSYRIHPTTWGGCGVLIHHVAENLLREGHEVVLLLDMPAREAVQFDEKDKLSLPNANRLKTFRVDALCDDFPYTQKEVPNLFQWKSLRFAHALSKLVKSQQIDCIEYFEYCGIGLASFVRKLYGLDFQDTILATRVHTTTELMDQCEATKALDAERYVMYGMEHAALRLAESVLIPGQSFFDTYYKDFYQVDASRTILSPPPMKALPRIKLKPDEQRTKITFIGRMYQMKGAEQLVKAAIMLLQRRKDRKLQFLLIGNDAQDSPVGSSYINYLRQLIPPTLQEQFHFTGYILHDKITEHLSESLFCVFPNRFESFCYALHEVAEAGLPIIANDLPAFRDSLKDGEDALFYDGSTTGLLNAMETLLEKPELRKKFEHSTTPKAAFTTYYYAQPHHTAALSTEDGAEIETRIVVLAGRSEEHNLQRTLQALSAQSSQRFSVLIFLESGEDATNAFAFLGRQWTAWKWNAGAENSAEPVDILQVQTSDALLVLRAGDEPDARWIQHCALALARRANSAFSGTWHTFKDQAVASTLDTAPEAQPFWHGNALIRVMLRTHPDQLLVDLFDPNLEALGETGYLWKAIAEFGHGTILPEPWMRVTVQKSEPPKPAHLGYLVARYGEIFRERLSLFNAVQAPLSQQSVMAPEKGLEVHSDSTLLNKFRAITSNEQSFENEDSLLRHFKETQHELQYIKSRLSYKLPQRLRTTSVYPMLRWIHADRKHLVKIQTVKNRSEPTNDREVWILAARGGNNLPSIPWDYVSVRGKWKRALHKSGASGMALALQSGTARFMLHGENPVLEFLAHPFGGKVKVSFGKRSQIIDLSSDQPRILSVHPALSPMLPRDAQKTHSSLATGDQCLPHEKEWLEKIYTEKAKVIALHTPRWLGVSASTQSLFEHTLALPHDSSDPRALGEIEIRRCVELLLESGVNHFVASGGDLIHYEVCKRLRQTKPSIRCDLLWHGTYLQFSEDYNWQVLQTWIEGAREGIVHTLGTVKKGQERFFESLGCRGKFVMNYVTRVPHTASTPDKGGPHLGLWLSSDDYRKMPYAMLSSLTMLPDAILHGSNFNPRAMETMNAFNIRKGNIYSQSLPRTEMLNHLRRTHLTLYITFAECAPMLPLESLAEGVPCLIGPTSHFFEDHEYLHSRLVVPSPDRAEIIADFAQQALRERNKIIQAWAEYAPTYVERARKSVQAFLESD